MASRTGWLLWLDRVSMTTMSPGASACTRTCLTYSRKPSPLMEPSRRWVAVTPLIPERLRYPRRWRHDRQHLTRRPPMRLDTTAHGVYPITPTPFHPDRRLDEAPI